MSYFAYILKSEYDGSHYYGSTKNVEERVKAHNSGKSRYTKGRRPWKLHCFEEFDTRGEAIKREAFFKSIEGFKYLKEKNIILVERVPRVLPKESRCGNPSLRKQ